MSVIPVRSHKKDIEKANKELDRLLEETRSDPVSWDSLKRRLRLIDPAEHWWLDA